MAFAKFQKNRFRSDGEIAENHAILVNLMASIDRNSVSERTMIHVISRTVAQARFGSRSLRTISTS